MEDKIRLSHGDGGSDTEWLIKNIFYHYFEEPSYDEMPDSFLIPAEKGRLAYTTDSFVVKPLLFRGGNIGKLSVCGTVNDLAATGAAPVYLSASFIIEEGFSIEKLHMIAKAMGEVCGVTGARIVTGDTKVVERGSADGLYINTSGIGRVSEFYQPQRIEPGDELIISGGIAEHGTAILIDRYDLGFVTELMSDCAPMYGLIRGLGRSLLQVKRMKDPTRGGLATALNEIAKAAGLDIEVAEEKVPMKNEVRSITDLLGMDPLYLACEGRMLLAVKKGCGEDMLERIRRLEYCGGARIIGRFTTDCHGMVYMKTRIGGKRRIPVLNGQMLPRIC